MVRVAVAGGGQGLGSVIAQSIASCGLHDCFILSRKAREDDPRYIVVDYTKIENVQNALEASGIHTVISVLSMENGGGKSQMNLIEAAERSIPTRRFMPSEFGMVYQEKHIATLTSYSWKLRAGQRLANSTLEYTHFSNYMFLDYFIAPKVPTPLTFAVPIWIDLENNFAAIPGDGEEFLSVTHTSDIGRYVAAVLDLPQWEKQYHLIGDRLSLNDMVRIAEELKDSTFEKYHDSKDKLCESKCTMLPAHKALLSPENHADTMCMMAASGLWVVDGEMDLDVNLSVNRLFPQMKTCTFRHAVQIWKETENELNI